MDGEALGDCCCAVCNMTFYYVFARDDRTYPFILVQFIFKINHVVCYKTSRFIFLGRRFIQIRMVSQFQCLVVNAGSLTALFKHIENSDENLRDKVLTFVKEKVSPYFTFLPFDLPAYSIKTYTSCLITCYSFVKLTSAEEISSSFVVGNSLSLLCWIT